MQESAHVRVGQVILTLAVCAVIGIPMAGFLWGTLNAALAGEAALWRLGLALPVLALFILLLARLSRQILRWHGGSHG